MVLGYSQKFPGGTPTYFMEKILITKDYFMVKDRVYFYCPGAPDFAGKPHTIREDVHDRWRPGMKIDHVYGNRSKDRKVFMTNECVSVQRISIQHNVPLIVTDERGNERQEGTQTLITVDGRVMNPETCNRIAINDGFDSLEHFFTWFKNDFYGKLIHWTKLRY